MLGIHLIDMFCFMAPAEKVFVCAQQAQSWLIHVEYTWVALVYTRACRKLERKLVYIFSPHQIPCPHHVIGNGTIYNSPSNFWPH